MSEPQYELLGPAEKMVAQQLRTAITSAEKAARNLADGLAEIDLDQVDLAMIDKRKESVIAMVGPAQSVAKNLADNDLFVKIFAIMLAAQSEAQA